MTKKAIPLTLIIASFPAMLLASNPPAKNADQTAPPAVTTTSPQSSVPKQAWIGNMKQTLPELLCQEDEYFVNCFKTTVKECQNFTHRIVDACLNNVTLALPEELNTQQKEYWGQMIGRCSYDLYDKFMQSKKRDIPNCSSPNKEENKKPKAK